MNEETGVSVKERWVKQRTLLPLKPRFLVELEGRYEGQGRKARFKACTMRKEHMREGAKV